MKIKKLLSTYKQLAKEIKLLANRYSYLDKKVRTPYHTQKDWEEYKATWSKILALSNQAYNVMLDYRTICESPLYKVAFALHLIKKQNGFRYRDESKTFINCSHLVNLVNLR